MFGGIRTWLNKRKRMPALIYVQDRPCGTCGCRRIRIREVERNEECVDMTLSCHHCKGSRGVAYYKFENGMLYVRIDDDTTYGIDKL
jgi:hypothetical protein